MRTILNNLNCEKSRKKAMFPRFALTTTVIVLCMIVMSLTAYAYYFYNVKSGSVDIKAATFETNVSITENDTSVTVTKENENYIANLEKDKTYTVTLEILQTSTAKTGFFVVTAKDCDEIYHTQQLGVDTAVQGGITNKVTFQIKVTSDTTVTFFPHWGTSSHYDAYKENGEGNKLYITNTNTGDKAVVMSINGVVNSIVQTNEQEENAEEEETLTEQTETETETEPKTETENEPEIKTEDLQDSETPETETVE